MGLIEITQKFSENDYQIYIVGGSVRDELLGKPSSDIDLCTDALPEETFKLLNGFGSVFYIGEKFGTVGLVALDGQKIEITTFRIEQYTEQSRKPNTEFSTDIYSDLLRRDFTINAIAKNLKTKELLDPHNGKKDLGLGIIRCVRSDDVTFNEDPLRMMRAIRFECTLGFTFIGKINYPERLNIVSKERIKGELDKIMLSNKASCGIKRLIHFGLMDYIIPELKLLQNIQHGKYHFKDPFDHSLLVLDKVSEKSSDLNLRYAALLHDISKADCYSEDETGIHFYEHASIGANKARNILQTLRFTNKDIDKIEKLVKYHMSPIMMEKQLTGTNYRKVVGRLVHKVGQDIIYDLLTLVRCDISSSLNTNHIFVDSLESYIKEYIEHTPAIITPPLNGEEIMELTGLKPSKKVGEIKNRLIQLIIDGELDKEDKEKATSIVLSENNL